MSHTARGEQSDNRQRSREWHGASADTAMSPLESLYSALRNAVTRASLVTMFHILPPGWLKSDVATLVGMVGKGGADHTGTNYYNRNQWLAS